MRIDSAAALSKFAGEQKARSTADTQVLISMGTCGLAAGAAAVAEGFREAIAAGNLGNAIELSEVGCMGLCYCEPTVIVRSRSTGRQTIYGDVTAQQSPAILAAAPGEIAPGTRSIERTWYYPEFESPAPGELQARIVLRNTGRLNPEKIEEYIAEDGYLALAKALASMTPADVIARISDSGLRGRGGAGFPTGRKWQFAAAQQSEEKFMICNADEGDPGAFMDRAVLEGDPHSVLEAMTIGGYAIGAHTGVIYIRAEYPLAVKRLEKAIEQSKAYGLLGKNILNSGFDFDIQIKYGAGAFVCGEETALIHSIEGMRGEPTFKPPFPAIQGLWKKPTVVNNVETYACIAAILRNGTAWFKSIGTELSPGTKVFALAGKISRVGLVEIPMGTPLRDIIFTLGDGIKSGKRFKAAQTGGPSGGCLTEKALDTPIDYESLKRLGSMMGSGGMIVMDEDDCMVNIARFFLEFTVDESCGKCTPCRVGNRRLYEMLTEICEGRGTLEMLDHLKTLAGVIKDSALCGLGQTSPNPALSTLANFEDEYLAHIKENRCPAGVCANLIHYSINDKCVGCGLCARQCPVNCISGERKLKHGIDESKCVKCGVCFNICKFHAVDKK